MSEFIENNKFIQNLINKNFSTMAIDCDLACDCAEHMLGIVVSIPNKEKFNELKIQFIPFSFSCVEIGNDYNKLKYDTKNMFDNDKYNIKRDIVICKKLKAMNKMVPCAVVYCKILNRIFSENYNEVLLGYLKNLINKINKIDDQYFNL